MKQGTPSTLLLGGGYSLSLLASKLPKDSFIITTTSDEKQARYTQHGWCSEKVSLEDQRSLTHLFSNYPEIDTIIDSVPPLKGESPTAGVACLLELLPKTVTRIFYLSTTGVYGKRDGSLVTEETPLTPFYKTSEARVAVEQLYRQRAGSAVTAFRLSGIYGPGRGIGLRLRSGAYRIVEGEDRPTNRIHVEDIVGVLLAALSFEGELPAALNVSDDYPAPVSEVIAFYQERFDLPAPKVISKEEAASSSGRLQLCQRVSNELLKKTLGYAFRFPTYREGAGSEFTAVEEPA